MFLADGERVMVIGSNAGNAKAPAWSLNLAANPDAEIEVRGERRACARGLPRARSASELWRRMNEQYAGFDDYDANTSRDIALFVLEPR